MSNTIGIRHEDLYLSERRAPLIPEHVSFLVNQKSLDIVVQVSDKRIFTNREYKQAGARLACDLHECPIILGVKELPIEQFENNKTYINFSHVVKGQPFNMPRLRRMMELNCNLIDYEKITDELGHRLIYFGYHAGLAGMINTLWALGLRYKEEGIETPFLKIKQAHKYNSLAEAQTEISEVGAEIAEVGLPDSILPLTIGFTGYGHVSQGAQEILGLLPVKEISPERVLKLKNRNCSPKNLIYKVVFKQEHIAENKEGKPFDKQDYYKHPEKYNGTFEQYLPVLSVLMNCMYWEPRFPRLVTKQSVKTLFNEAIDAEAIQANGDSHQLPRLVSHGPKLKVIGDITCDPDGSIEITHKGTEPEDPLFVYDPFTDSQTMGYKGNGLLVMAVHILPSELPRESSQKFSGALIHYLEPIANCDFNVPYGELILPDAIKRALILHRGKLTPPYIYLNEFITSIANENVLKLSTT